MTTGRGTKIGANYDLLGQVGSDCVIGDCVVVHRSAVVGDNVTIGNYSSVGLQHGIGDNSTIGIECHISFDVPANSYVEVRRNFGNGYATYVMWTPDGIFIKPGCQPLEAIAATRARLRHIKNGDIEWPEMVGDPRMKAEAARMLRWLSKMATYEVVVR